VNTRTTAVDYTGWVIRQVTKSLRVYATSTGGSFEVSNQYLIGINQLVIGQQYHIAISYDGDKITGYLDGEQKFVSPSVNIMIPNQPLVLSGSVPNSNVGGECEIDEFMFFDKALSYHEVQAIYNDRSASDAIPGYVAATEPNSFQLQFGGFDSGDIDFAADNATIQSTLESLPAIGAGNISVEEFSPIVNNEPDFNAVGSWINNTVNGGDQGGLSVVGGVAYATGGYKAMLSQQVTLEPNTDYQVEYTIVSPGANTAFRLSDTIGTGSITNTPTPSYPSGSFTVNSGVGGDLWMGFYNNAVSGDISMSHFSIRKLSDVGKAPAKRITFQNALGLRAPFFSLDTVGNPPAGGTLKKTLVQQGQESEAFDMDISGGPSVGIAQAYVDGIEVTSQGELDIINQGSILRAIRNKTTDLNASSEIEFVFLRNKA
jgi:hypothetical protein